MTTRRSIIIEAAEASAIATGEGLNADQKSSWDFLEWEPMQGDWECLESDLAGAFNDGELTADEASLFIGTLRYNLLKMQGDLQ